MASNNPFEVDVAVSFASEDRQVAEEIAGLLSRRNLEVLRDEYTAAATWGNDPLVHLVNLCARKARYCVLLVSKHYPLTKWTEAERASVQELALRDADEYILPIRLDDTEVPGIAEVTGFKDLRQHDLHSIVDSIAQKIEATRKPSGTPLKSHDFRSGNVPSADNENQSR